MASPFFVLPNNVRLKSKYLAFDVRERGLTQILTYDHKHFARVPWVQIEDF
jgi:hypothetical protein